MGPLHAFLYMHLAEQMPENVTDEWFLRPDTTAPTSVKVDLFREHAEGLIDDLAELEDEDAFQSAFYERAKAAFGTDGASIREFFKMLYLVILERDSGPRWGMFVSVVGRDKFRHLLRTKLDHPFSFQHVDCELPAEIAHDDLVV